MRLWARRLAAVAAVAYLATLFVIFLLLRFVGEHWWATGVGLYVPRVGFLLPLPFTTAALAFVGPRKLLYTQVAAALFVLFPMMGLVVSVPARRGEPTLRVLSFNVNSGYAGADTVVGAITKYSPDIVLIQEVFENGKVLHASVAAAFPTVQGSTQFLIGSRFPIESTFEPDRLPQGGYERAPGFIRYVLRTPLGELAVYNVHPISPRHGMYGIRAGLKKEILSGRAFGVERTAAMQTDSALRANQVRAFAARAAAEKGAVILGGDTNLPTLSPVLASELAPFVDGFASAGSGFGYTFPAKHPWMRIDRIMTSHDLKFTSFSVGCQGASDHLCVVADIQRR